MTDAHPGHAHRRRPGRRSPSASRARACPVDDALLERLRGGVRRGDASTTRPAPRPAGTGGPSPSAGPPAGAVPGPPRRGGPAHRRRPGGRGAGRLPRRPASRSRPWPGARVCAGRASRCSAAWRSTCAGWPASSTSTPRRCWPSVLPGHLRPRPRGASCAPTASPSGTGPSRWTCRRWAAGWPVAARASTRPATGRSRTWSPGLEVALADGRVIRTGGAGPARRRSAPT